MAANTAPTSAVWEIRNGGTNGTGSDSNGGFFLPGSGGTDYSQQNTAQLSLTDVVTNGNTTVTSATGGFTSAMVGNGFNIAGVPYEITAVGNSTSITINGSPAAATGQTGKVGGACASPGFVAGMVGVSNTVWMNGNFTIGSGTANTTGNRLSVAATGSNLAPMIWQGYGTIRGDSGIATFTAGGGGYTLFGASTYGLIAVNIAFNGNSFTGGIGASGPSVFINCTSTGFATGFGGGAIYHNCVASSCTSYGFNGSASTQYESCVAISCTNDGFYLSTNAVCTHCIAISCGTGFGVTSNGAHLRRCVAHGCTSYGFYFNSNQPQEAIDCIATSCSTYGFYMNSSSNAVLALAINCAQYNNGNSNSYGNFVSSNVIKPITLSALPYVNQSAGNYNVSRASGLWNASNPSTLPGLGNTTTYLDVGATGHVLPTVAAAA